MTKNIKDRIKEACKKEGINYISLQDAKRLGEIIFEVSGLIDELDCIFERHNIKTKIKEQLQYELQELHCMNHDLVRLATEIKKEK